MSIKLFNEKKCITYLIFNLVAKRSIVYIISNYVIYFILLFRKKKPSNAQYLRATPRSPRNQSGRPVRRVRYRRPRCSPAFHGTTTTARYVFRVRCPSLSAYTHLHLFYNSRAVYCSHRSSAVRACAPTKNPNGPCGVIAAVEHYTSVRPIGRGARSGRAASNADGI